MATEVKTKSWWQKALFDSESGIQTPQTVQTPQLTTQRIPVRKTSPTPIMTQPVTIPDNGEVDESYINHLYDFMTKNNLPGPDYFEFANSLDEMTTELEGASEEKIFQMTYKVAYKQNLPVPTLLETAQKYIQLFEQHKKEFDAYLVSESQKTIGIKTDEIIKLEKINNDSITKIEELKKQISLLESQMDSNNLKIEDDNSTVEVETEKLNLKKSKFEKAFNIIITKINDDISKIKQYLNK